MKHPRKYDFIDCLRGYAILGVVMVHTQSLVAPASQALSDIASAGARGVQLFFIVSAMTLCLSMHARYGEAKVTGWRPFMVRRFFRIAPMFYAAIVFYLLFRGLGPSEYAPDGIQWFDIASVIAFLHGWLPTAITSVVPGSWSIAAEMMFYLSFPLLWRYGGRFKRALVLLVIAILFATIARPLIRSFWGMLYPEEYRSLIKIFSKLWFPSQAFVFVTGYALYCLIAEKINHESDDAKQRKIGRYCTLGGATAFTIFALTSGDLVTYTLSLAFFVYGMTFYQPAWLVNRAMVFTGQVSFSVYLIHFAVIDLLQNIWPQAVSSSADLDYALGLAAVLAISLPASALTYRFIELPGIALGRKVNGRLDKKAQAPEQA